MIGRRGFLKAMAAAVVAPALPIAAPAAVGAGAISIPFSTLPMNVYIRGPRYPVAMNRIVTPRFTKDVDEMRVYRQIQGMRT